MPPPRIHPPSRAIITSTLCCKRPLQSSRNHQTQAAIRAAGLQSRDTSPAILHYPPTQPPSFKPPEFRKSQLLRQYVSLLRSTPLILIFQHNNIKSTEWLSLRRELTKALQKLDDSLTAAGHPPTNLSSSIKLQIIQTGILAAAIRVVEFYKPEPSLNPITSKPGHPIPVADESKLIHTLSKAAHTAAISKTHHHPLSPLMSGPIVLLTFPAVSPTHLKSALSILSPSKGPFAAPTRRANPGWHDPTVQSGLQKLILLGARVEGRVLDMEDTKWVGGLPSLDGLRAELVGLLQGVGGQVTTVLESAGRSLYYTVEGRRTMLDDQAKEGAEGEVNEGK